MSLYRLLSALLSYPEQELLDALPEIDAALAEHPWAGETLEPLTAWLGGQALIPLQETYVATFDRNRSHSLHLFEHVHGESRDRGQPWWTCCRPTATMALNPWCRNCRTMCRCSWSSWA